MSEDRQKRDQDTQAKSERKTSWKRPELLPDPDPQDGIVFHWVRVSSLGEVDALNVSSKIREGWTPAKAKDHPEIFVAAIENERFKDNIVIGGLMLCRAPKELVEERSAFYREQTQAQMHAVDNNLMSESDPRMPVFNDRSSKVTFGTGN